MKRNSLWASRLGIYFAAIGSAVGLGNLWRFPYVVSENGGGAFVLLYMFLVITIGGPILIGELLLGRMTRKGILLGARDLVQSEFGESRSKFQKRLVHWGSVLMMIVAFFMLAYLTVVSSWVLYYFYVFFQSIFFEAGKEVFAIENFKNNGLIQSMLVLVHLLGLVLILVRQGEKVIEKWVSFIVPLFSIILIFIAFQTLNLENAQDALKYFLYPNFSKLNWASFSYALGHVCFTLGVGLGLIVSFGRYLSSNNDVPLTGFRVVLVDSTVSLLAGLLVFPLVFSGLYSDGGQYGPELLFETVPQFLMTITYGKYIGLSLFLCLYVSAAGACIGILDSLASNFQEISDNRSYVSLAWVSGAIAAVLAIGIVILNSSFQNLEFLGYSVFQLFDMALVNVFLPLTCLVAVFLMFNYVDQNNRKKEFFVGASLVEKQIYRQWEFSIKYLLPIIYIISFGLLIYNFL